MPNGIGYSSTLKTASRAATVKAQENERKGEESPSALPVTSPLVGYLNSIWDRNRRGREEITATMLDNLRAYRNEYDAAKLEAIRQEGGSDVFMGLTRTKCRHGISWLMDIFTSADKPWSLEPSPVPDPTGMARAKAMQVVAAQIRKRMQEGSANGPVTPELLREVMTAIQPIAEETLDIELHDRALRMEKLVHDQLLEGGFYPEFRQFIRDLVILKAGIIKGPIARKVDTYRWEQGPDGKFTRKKETKTRPFWKRVSPFDLYPDAQADTMEGPIVERMQLMRADLSELKGEKGYIDEALNRVIRDFSKYSCHGNDEPNDTERRELEEKEDDPSSISAADSVTAKEFTLKVPGDVLQDYKEQGVLRGIPGAPEKIDDTMSYDMNVILVDNEVIFIKFDKDPVDRVRYYKYGWDEVNGSFWYEGVPETMSDLQKICNASARALVNNMGVASGPMAEIDVDRLLPGESIEGMKPFRIFQTVSNGRANAPAVRFFMPESNTADLLHVYDAFAKLADEYTGIPAYSYGNDRVAGAGRTSSGLSMLMSAAARGIKDVILGLDDNVIKPLVQAQVDWNMKYHDDDRVKGDVHVISTGAVALMVREQMADKRMQFLAATANPTDMELIGMEGRANVLREVARSLELSSFHIVKDPEEVRSMVDGAEASKQAAEQKAQELAAREAEVKIQAIEADIRAKQLQAQVAMAQLQLEKQKLDQTAAKVQGELALKARGQDLDAQHKRDERSLGARKFVVEQNRAAAQDKIKASEAGMKNLLAAKQVMEADEADDQAMMEAGGGAPIMEGGGEPTE